MKVVTVRIISLWAACGLAAACTPPGGPEDLSGKAGRPDMCVGTVEPRCVVYLSGPVSGGIPADRGLNYQLQGTGMPDAGDGAHCLGGYCAVAILGTDGSGRPKLLTHVESSEAGWYERPRVIGSPVGPLVVAESNSLGSGLFNDDIVLRYEGETLRRIDVQSWKSMATGLTPGANTHFDWMTDYGQLVGSISLMSGAPDEWVRDPQGGCAKVFLFLEGDALKLAAPPVRLPRERC